MRRRSNGKRRKRRMEAALLSPPDEIASGIVENLEAALDRFRKVAASLAAE